MADNNKYKRTKWKLEITVVLPRALWKPVKQNFLEHQWLVAYDRILLLKGNNITISGHAKNDPDGMADPIAHY